MDNQYVGFQERENYRGRTDVATFRKLMSDPRAELAIALVERWGMVAAVPDGEDTAGRSRLRLQTVEELLARACAVSDALFAEIERREWQIALPTPKLEQKPDTATA